MTESKTDERGLAFAIGLIAAALQGIGAEGLVNGQDGCACVIGSLADGCDGVGHDCVAAVTSRESFHAGSGVYLSLHQASASVETISPQPAESEGE
jgi:hypothetical protein